MAKKKRSRRSYDLPPEVIKRLDELSAEFGIPQGHLLALFTIEGIEMLERGEINLDEYLYPHLNSLRYRWGLDLSSRLKDLEGDDE